MKADKGSRNWKRMDVWEDMSVEEITKEFAGAGYAGKRMAEAGDQSNGV